MLTRKQKEEELKNLIEKLKRQKIAVFSTFKGLSVAKLQALRRALKAVDAEYKVMKKTIIDRALGEAGIAFKTKDAKDEIGLALGYGDEVAPTKTIAKFGKENEAVRVVGGVLGNRILEAKEILQMAKLPAKEVLMAQVASAFVAPIRGLVTVLSGNMRNLVVVLSKIKDNKSV